MPIAAFLMDLDRSLGLFIAEHGTLIYALMAAIVFCEMAFAPLFFLPGDPMLVVEALQLSRAITRRIRQNLFWAFAYNVAGIPLAALGYLDPVLAGAAMALSSLSVMANALLLKRWRPSKPGAQW